jgi:predicted amidophosphoribosyltransferase
MLWSDESWIWSADLIDLRPGTALGQIGRLFRPPLACSFCGRSAEQVERLVAGAFAYICDDCITQCLDVLERHPKDPRLPNEAERP